jgi:hypothetical protein
VWTLAAGAVALAAMALTVAAAMWWVRGHTGAGSAGAGSGTPSVAGLNTRQFLSYLWQFYLPKLSFMNTKVGPPYGYRQVYIETFFGSFASFSVNYRLVYYDALQVGAALGLVGLYTAAVVRWRTVIANWPVVVVSATFFAGLMALLHLVSYSSLRTGQDPVITGRYLLPAIALYGAAGAWVCASLPRRIGLPLAGVLLGAAVLLAVGGIGLSVERFYA